MVFVTKITWLHNYLADGTYGVDFMHQLADKKPLLDACKSFVFRLLPIKITL
jgi:hypothetical protein